MRLSPLEQELVACVAAGKRLDRHAGGEITEAAMDQWREDRWISAAVIRQILLGRLVEEPDPHGVRIRGVRITGELDLENVRSNVELSLMSCDLPDGVNLRDAHLTVVAFNGCRIGVGTSVDQASLSADRLTADALLLAVDSDSGRPCTTAGAVCLPGAHITGQLDLSGAQLHGQDSDGNSLIADRLQVDSSAFLRIDSEQPFTAAGALRLLNAHITGQLDLSGAQLHGQDSDGNSLIADGLQVNGPAFLRADNEQPFTAAGALRLLNAHITGQLVLSGARLLGHDSDGDSLIADRLQVDSDLFLRVDNDQPFTTTGALRLRGAHIIGQLVLSGAQLQGHDSGGYSLIADGLRVDSDVFLRVGNDQPFTTTGALSLSGAHISGQLDLSGAQLRGHDSHGDSLIADSLQVDGDVFLSVDNEQPFSAVGALRLQGAHITGRLVLSDAQLGDGELDLGGATLGELWLDPGSVQRIELTGLTYAGLPRRGELGDWLDVIRHKTTTAGYSPQPYQQLAAACRSAGHERDARRVLIAQQDDRRDRLLRPMPGSGRAETWRLWWRRFGLRLQKLALGYGYQARRAFYGTVAALGAACLIGVAAGHTHSASTGHHAAYRPSANGAPGQQCSTVEQIGLGLHPGLPFLSTVTAGQCEFDTATTPGGSYAIINWALQALAWAGAALAIAGYTGLVRKT